MPAASLLVALAQRQFQIAGLLGQRRAQIVRQRADEFLIGAHGLAFALHARGDGQAHLVEALGQFRQFRLALQFHLVGEVAAGDEGHIPGKVLDVRGDAPRVGGDDEQRRRQRQHRGHEGDLLVVGVGGDVWHDRDGAVGKLDDVIAVAGRALIVEKADADVVAEPDADLHVVRRTDAVVGDVVLQIVQHLLLVFLAEEALVDDGILRPRAQLGDADVDDDAQHQRGQHDKQHAQADARVAQGDLRRFFALPAIQRDTPFPRRS